MRPKLKPHLNLMSVRQEVIQDVSETWQKGLSIREIGRQKHLSPMKVRKILITAGLYTSKRTEQIAHLHQAGASPREIAEQLHTSVANITSYLPYQRIIYKLEERSVGADRQRRYRERKKKEK